MTESPPANHGVVISGNAQVTGAVAGGFQASARQYGDARSKDAARAAALLELDALIRLLNQHPDAPPGAHETAAELQVALTEEPPVRGRVTAALTRLAAQATAIGAVAEAADRVSSAIQDLLP